MSSRIRGQGKGDALPVDEAERKLAFRAWLAYYNLLGAYSSLVCGGRDQDGAPVPATSEEQRMVAAKKRRLREEKIQPLKGIVTDQVIREESFLALKEYQILMGRDKK
jgi:hypothetical protein